MTLKIISGILSIGMFVGLLAKALERLTIASPMTLLETVTFVFLVLIAGVLAILALKD